MGAVSLISGGNQRSSITEKFGVEPESNDSTSPDESEYKKLIVGKWKNAGDDIGSLSEVIDEYTADGKIIIWDAKDGAVAGRGKYQFLTDNRVKFTIFDTYFGNYTATIRISGDEMTFTFEDGKSGKHRRVRDDGVSAKASHDASMLSARAKNAAKMKLFMTRKEVEQLTGKPDFIKRTRLGDTLWLYYTNPQRGAEKHAVEIVVGFAKKDPNRASILWIQDKLLFAGNDDYRSTGGLQVGPWKED
jgi:hypothetical protein